MDLNTLTITTAHEALKAGDFTVRQLVDAYLEQIEAKNDQIKAYLHLHTDIDSQVDKAQAMFADGSATVLTGIPLALKTNINRKGQLVTSSAKILENYTAPYNATVVDKLEAMGVVFLGDTNMDEFALGSSTENSAFGPTRNPANPDYVPGGTSGGSAAAVAANMALAALGTDTGGSIRQPSALCGVTGFKNTYGGVSRYGVSAAASSLEQIGPIAKNAADARILWQAIRGQDEQDMNTVADESFTDSTTDSPRVAYSTALLDGIDPEIKRIFLEQIEAMKAAGWQVDDVDLAFLGDSLSAYYIINFAEVSSNLARYDGMRYGAKADGAGLWDEYVNTRSQYLGPEVKRRIMLGTYVLSAGYADQYYTKALAIREQIKAKLAEVFENYDLIATPTTPNPAFKIGEKNTDPVQLYLEDIFTVTANIAGIPAISLPMGTVEDLPVGLQLMAAPLADETLLAAASALQST